MRGQPCGDLGMCPRRGTGMCRGLEVERAVCSGCPRSDEGREALGGRGGGTRRALEGSEHSGCCEKHRLSGKLGGLSQRLGFAYLFQEPETKDKTAVTGEKSKPKDPKKPEEGNRSDVAAVKTPKDQKTQKAGTHEARER